MASKSEMEKRVRKSCIDWTNESTILLIENVKLNENIWNLNDPKYRDRKAHEISWNSISRILELSKEDAVNKWNAIRGNYRVFRKNQISGHPAGKKRPNVYFCRMSFLDSVLNLTSNNTTSDEASPKNKVRVKIAENANKQEIKEENPKQKRRCAETKFLGSSPPTLKKKNWKDETLDIGNESALKTLNTVDQKIQEQKQILPNWNHNDIISNTSSETIARRIAIGKDDDDEWSALGKLITTNSRTWATENVAFARSYKAELSAINAKFELEAAKMTHAIASKYSSVSEVSNTKDDGRN